MIKKMWWIADDQADAKKMATELLEKGALNIRICGEDPIGVFFSVDTNTVEDVLGYVPDEDEYLEKP